MYFKTLFKHCPCCGSENFVINNEKSKRCEHCGFVMYINPSAAVAAFIENDKNQLLVCRRAKDPAKGTLDLPGGFVDEHETAEEAIRREISEELNAETETARYLFSLPNRYIYSGWNIPTLDMFFSCKLKETRTLQASDDVASFEYISFENLNPDDFGLESIKKSIEIFIQEKTQK